MDPLPARRPLSLLGRGTTERWSSAEQLLLGHLGKAASPAKRKGQEGRNAAPGQQTEPALSLCSIILALSPLLKLPATAAVAHTYPLMNEDVVILLKERPTDSPVIISVSRWS